MKLFGGERVLPVLLLSNLGSSLVEFGESTRECSPGHAGKEGPQLARTGASQGFPRAAAPVGEKVGLKLNIQKTKIMASGPITSWEIDGETVETVSDFIFLGSKITADGDCSHEIKMLTPWKESYDQPR